MKTEEILVIEEYKPEINDNPDSALKLMNQGKNVFLSGDSKSTSSVLNIFRESNPEKEILFFAPYDVSALKIKAKNIYDFFCLKSDWERLHQQLAPAKLAELKETDCVVVININEVTPRYLDFLDICLSFCHDTSEHFGNRQVICAGSFLGTRPEDSKIRAESKFGDDYSDRYAFFSNAWLCAEFETAVLNNNYHQD